MTLATLNGFEVSRATVQIGAWGCPWVDCDLVDPETVAGRATFAIGGVSIACAVVAGGVAEGRASYRLVGGAGGWGKTVSEKAYVDDAGVKAATVLGDAASAAGETVDAPPATRLGPHYARANVAANFVLNDIAPKAWRVDFDGVTRFGPRPTTAYAGDAVRTKRAPAAGVVELAAEDVTPFLPGVMIDGSAPATDIEFALDAKRLTVRVYSGPTTNRFLDAQRRIIEALFPWLRYAGAYEFRVVTQSGERLNLQPVRTGTGLPALTNVSVRPGMAGLKCQALPGCLVVVQFLDHDPSRPVVTGFDAPDAPGWMPLEIDIGGPGALGVARQTDPVQAGPFGGVIVLGSLRVKAAV